MYIWVVNYWNSQFVYDFFRQGWRGVLCFSCFISKHYHKAVTCLNFPFLIVSIYCWYYLVDLVKEGTTVILRNAKIDMFKGSMRLAVDKWGRVEVAEPADFTVKEDNNLSLIEYELVNVVEEWLFWTVFTFLQQPDAKIKSKCREEK